MKKVVNWITPAEHIERQKKKDRRSSARSRGGFLIPDTDRCGAHVINMTSLSRTARYALG